MHTYLVMIGGPHVAQIVSTAAAKHLTPVILELGGKSPVIIDPACNIKMAAKSILWGKVINAGQTCVAPDYILVPQSFQDTNLHHDDKHHHHLDSSKCDHINIIGPNSHDNDKEGQGLSMYVS